MRDLDATGAAWVAVVDQGADPYDCPEYHAREAVFARVRAWNEQQARGVATATVAHQPREQAVRCTRCRTVFTLDVHAVCKFCGPVRCERCATIQSDSPAAPDAALGEGGDAAAGVSPRVTAAAGPSEHVPATVARESASAIAAAGATSDLPPVDAALALTLATGEHLLAMAERLNRMHDVAAEQRSTAKRWSDVADAARTLADALRPAALPRRIPLLEQTGSVELVPDPLGEQFEAATRALTILQTLADAASAAARRSAEWTAESIQDFRVDDQPACGATTTSFVGLACVLDAHGLDVQHQAGPYSWAEPTRG